MFENLVDRWSVIISLASFLFCWMLFWSQTGEPMGSFFAGAMTGGLVFLACLTFKMIFLTYKK
jgi:hypothetical protein